MSVRQQIEDALKANPNITLNELKTTIARNKTGNLKVRLLQAQT